MGVGVHRANIDHGSGLQRLAWRSPRYFINRILQEEGLAVSRTAEIIRGDDQTIPVPVSGLFDDLTGATAYLFVLPKDSIPTDTVVDPAALITSTIGPLVVDVETLDFEIAGADTLIPVGTYAWYARVEEADNTLTTIRFKPRTVEVTAPGDEDC